MTTLVDLVTASPDPTFGRAVSNIAPYTHIVYELADPGAGVSVEWFDITEIVSLGPAGHDLTRGADEFDGAYRASVVHLDIYADDDSLAPWLDDTSATFGTHVPLGAGLLIRCSLVTISGGVVTAWNPRFTNKVERWGDATFARGTIRRHPVTARDLLTSLVAVSVPASSEQNWSERVDFLLDESAWPYGSQVYGAQFTSALADILTVPARAAQSSALAELRATLDPAGLIAYTDRRGVLIVRPRHDDTFHATAFGAGASGTPWPGFDPVVFSNLAHDDPGVLDLAAFAVDSNQAEPFGFPDSEDAVRNRVVVTVAGSTVYDDDDPTSIQRHDPRELPLTWIAANNGLAATILATRANATKEAAPLFTTESTHGFYPGPITAEFYQDIEIRNQTAAGRETATATGVLRQYRERMQPGVNTVFIDLAFVVDVHGAIDVSASLLPPEDLLLDDVSDTSAEFSWTNPTQTITPTHTQVRMLNPSSLWATVDYPITGIVWGGLDPSTDYIFQVRYVREVDGLITHFSPSTTYGFTTDATTVPDWDGEDVDFPDPDTGCTLEWELQSSPDQVAVTTEDSGTISTPPWTLDDYDTTGLDNNLWYRFRVREVCSGTPGAWAYGPWWVLDCLPVAALATPPFDDPALVAYWPQICPVNLVTEAVTEQAADKGPAIGGVGTDDDGNATLLSNGEGAIVYGTVPTELAGDSDATLTARVKLGAQPAAEVILFQYGSLRITATADGAGFAVHGEAAELGAGWTTISGPTELALDTEYVVTLTHDVSAGDLILYVDGVEEVDALGTVGERLFAGAFLMALPADSWGTDYALFDALLTPIPSLHDAILALNPLGYWRLDETAGTNANDASSYANHDGTYTGTYTLNAMTGADGDPVCTFTNGYVNIGSAAEFELTTVASPGTALGLTFFAMVRPTNSSTARRFVFGKASTAPQYRWAFSVDPGAATMRFENYSSTGGNRATAISTVTNIATNAWNAIACSVATDGVGTAADIKLYNGSNTDIAGGETTNTSSATGGGTQLLYIGDRADGGATEFVGQIARCAIFDGVLNATQIQSLMDSAAAEGWI